MLKLQYLKLCFLLTSISLSLTYVFCFRKSNAAEEDDENENSSLPEEDEEQFIKANTITRARNAEQREKEIAPEAKKAKKRKLNNCSPSYQSELNETSNISQTDDEDGYKLFFLSMLPEFRKLNDDQKLDFRLHILQFFRDARPKKTSETDSNS